MSSSRVLLTIPLVTAVTLLTSGCRVGALLSVPPPLGVVANATNTQSGAENVFLGEKINLFNNLAGSTGLFNLSELLSDELTENGGFSFNASIANMDARQTAAAALSGAGRAYNDGADFTLQYLLGIRETLSLDIQPLEHFPADSAVVGEAFALNGYIDLLLAEDFCAGVPLDVVSLGGASAYGSPLTTDSLLEIARADFDSAIAHASGSTAVRGIAFQGLARTDLNLGDFKGADTAAQQVPTSYVYNATMGPTAGDQDCCNFYQYPGVNFQCGWYNVSDSEGTNGFDFISAHDPRLTFDSTSYPTCDWLQARVVPSTWYYPLKFENNPGDISFVTGIEARLVEAEVALSAENDPITWLSDLNTLRESGYTVQPSGDTVWSAGTGGVPGLNALVDPVTDSGRVRLMFRERSFWLYGTGIRLGDMRRMIRAYGQWFSAANVYPIGAYPTGPDAPAEEAILRSNGYVPLTEYGSDVSITLPTHAASNFTTSNPTYKGCIAPTTQA